MKTFGSGNNLEDYLRFFLAIWLVVLFIGLIFSGPDCFAHIQNPQMMSHDAYHKLRNALILRELEVQTLYF